MHFYSAFIYIAVESYIMNFTILFYDVTKSFSEWESMLYILIHFYNT